MSQLKVGSVISVTNKHIFHSFDHGTICIRSVGSLDSDIYVNFTALDGFSQYLRPEHYKILSIVS